jgi:hypothetical protein
MKEIQSTKSKITRRDSFVIRIWQEEGKPGWKGWVQHARSGESSLIGFYRAPPRQVGHHGPEGSEIVKIRKENLK